MHRLLPACLALLAVLPAQAATDERVQLQAEIRRLERRFDAEEAACGKRFLVTACVDDSRVRRRDALAPLHTRLMALDDAQRRRQADERRSAVRAKQQELARQQELAKQPDALPEAASAAARRPLLPGPAASSQQHGNAPTPAQRRQAGEAAAAERAAAAARRQQEIAHDAERIRQRLQARQRQGKQSAPLPTPAASVPPP